MGKKYVVSVKNLGGGGLVDVASPTLIAANESPLMYNVDVFNSGMVEARGVGSERVGDGTGSDGLQVVGLIDFPLCDTCNQCGDETAACSTTNQGPIPTCEKVLVKFVGYPSGITKGFYKLDSKEEWTEFTTIKCVHQMQPAWHSCRLMYSNGFSELEYACFSKDDTSPTGVKVEVGTPTCASVYCNNFWTNITLVPSSTINGVNSLVAPLAGQVYMDLPVDSNGQVCLFQPLIDYIKANPQGQIKLWVNTEANGELFDCTRRNDPCGTYTGTEMITIKGTPEIPLALVGNYRSGIFSGGNVLRFGDMVLPASGVSGGTFNKGIILEYIGGCTELTTCGNCPDTRTSENVRGYILKVFDGRLFVTGDLTPGYQNQIYYSGATNGGNVLLNNLPFYPLDFRLSPDGVDSYGDIIRLNKQAGTITGLVETGGALYAHYDSCNEKKIYQLGFVSTQDSTTGLGIGGYIARDYFSGNATNWFRNVANQDGVQQFIEQSSEGTSRDMRFGIFQGYTTPTVRDEGYKISNLLNKTDFSQGATIFSGKKTYMAGLYRGDDCLGEASAPITIDSPECDNGCADNSLYRNNIVVVRDFDTGAYTVIKGWGVSNFYKSCSGVMFGSSSSGDVYKLNESLYDEVSVDNIDGRDLINSHDIESYFSTKAFTFEQYQYSKKINKVRIVGFISPGTDLEVGFDFDCSIQNKAILNMDNCGCESNSSVNALSSGGCGNNGLCGGKFGSKMFNAVINFTPQIFDTVRVSFGAKSGYWGVTQVAFELEEVEKDCFADCKNMVQCI